MKQLFLTVLMLLFAVVVSANTSCEVEGSSNNNVATLGESYYRSLSTRDQKCVVKTSVTLAKRSLGKTVVVIEVYDQYNQSVGNEIVTIYEGHQESGEVRFTVNNSSYDGICGEYKFKIASATCEEKKKDTSMKKPSAYTDLGLPSGTLWKNSNETDETEYLCPKEASYKYESALPTKKQWEELIDNCKWEWTNNPYGANVTGPNGNSIFLSADGRNDISKYSKTDDNGWKHILSCKRYRVDGHSKGYYCTAFDPNTKAWYQVEFGSNAVKMDSVKLLDDEISVRLVKAPTENNIPVFVDLGLPSGTKWKNMDEEESSSSLSSYSGLSIPTKKQWTELEKSCTWTWLGTRYRVTGPNGNSIYFKPYGFSHKCYECNLFEQTRLFNVYLIKDMECYDGACEYYGIDEYGYGITELGDKCTEKIRLVETPKTK